MTNHFVAIGHVTEDLTKSGKLIGGGVTYSGLAAKELGQDVEIITKLPQNHMFIDFLKSKNISVYNLPTKNGDVTTFVESYNLSGDSLQSLLMRQEDIIFSDLDILPREVFENSLILIAPVISEIEIKVIPYLSTKGRVTVTPQGYFRDVDKDGNIFQKNWKGYEEYLSHAEMVILSEEDLKIKDVFGDKMFEQVKNASTITVLTRGRNGADIYNGNNNFHIDSFPLAANELKDFTGAGDVFAAALVIKYEHTKDLYEAAVFASFFAGVKVAGIGGIGVNSIPSIEQLEKYKLEHSSQLKDFIKTNNATEEMLNI